MGTGFIDDSEVDAGGNVEEDITKEVGTCGCASATDVGWTPLLGVGLLLMLRRRR